MLDVVADGLGFPEGPVMLPDGGIAFVDLTAQGVYRLDPRDGTVETIARVPGSPNGMCLGADGALYVANNGGIGPLTLDELFHATDAVDGCVQRIGLDGSVDVVTPPLPGPAPHRPNDICTDASGALCFTDPVNWEVLPDREAYRVGHVFRTDSTGPPVLVADVPDFPNGIGVDPSSGDLVVAQTVTGTLLRLPWRAGRYEEPEPWAELGAGSAPDGFCWSPDGRLIVAGSTSDALYVIDVDGQVAASIALFAGSDPTNVCLAGDTLWVTLGLPGAIGRLPLAAL